MQPLASIVLQGLPCRRLQTLMIRLYMARANANVRLPTVATASLEVERYIVAGKKLQSAGEDERPANLGCSCGYSWQARAAWHGMPACSTMHSDDVQQTSLALAVICQHFNVVLATHCRLVAKAWYITAPAARKDSAK